MHFKNFLSIFFIFAIMGCNNSKADGQVKNKKYSIMLSMMLSKKTPAISVQEAHQDAANYVFVDAREKPEYEVSHIKGAKFIGYDNFDVKEMEGLKKDAPIVVYCSVGKRSENITRKLDSAGFTNILNMYGGIFEWVNEGFPVYDANNDQTQKVHAYSKTWGIWLNKGEKVY